MRIAVNKATVDVSFVLLLIITYAINYPLFASMRPVDIVLIAFAIWGISHNRIRLTGPYFLTMLFAMLMLLSALYGSLFIGIQHPENFIFFYKYAILFVCTWLVTSARLTERQISYLLKALLASFVLVVVYEFCSLWRMVSASPELLAKFRPNFPFTPPFGEHGGYLGDAHMLAAYLSTGLLAIFFSHQAGLLKLRSLVYYPLLLSVAGAMFLTGSRNGIATSSAVVCCFLLGSLMKRILSPTRPFCVSRRSLRTCAVIVLLVCGISILSAHGMKKVGGAERVLKRALSFEFSTDASALGRVRKLANAADLVFQGPLVLGVGMQSSDYRFFDGALGAILVSAGLVGVLVYPATILLFLANLRTLATRNARKAEYMVVLLVTVNYVLANLITEFFLVSRSVIPFCVFLGLMTKRICSPNFHAGCPLAAPNHAVVRMRYSRSTILPGGRCWPLYC